MRCVNRDDHLGRAVVEHDGVEAIVLALGHRHRVASESATSIDRSPKLAALFSLDRWCPPRRPKRAASLPRTPPARRRPRAPARARPRAVAPRRGAAALGLQSELFAPWRSDACHDPTEWCWTGADGAASVDLGDGRYAWLFGDSLVSRVARSPARRVMDDAWLPASTVGIIGAPAAGAAWRDMRFYWRPAAAATRRMRRTTTRRAAARRAPRRTRSCCRARRPMRTARWSEMVN